ncbi:MAG: hypothetical protein GY810_07065 [Aureispira sp.]|nr:hypothetical protein [Aureispira sp.]
MNNTKLVNGLFVGILILMFLPILQQTTNLIELAPLGGHQEAPADVSLSSKSWLSGDYQVQKEKYIGNSFGFRSTFIRLHNQLDYALYSYANAKGSVIGQQGYLFQMDYIKNRNGFWYEGEVKAEARLQAAQRVQKELAARGKHFLIMLAPSKIDYYAELLPVEHQVDIDTVKNDYKLYTKGFEKYGINHINANEWFLGMKDTTSYPLYPKTGIHYSSYGAALVVDSMLKNIETALGKDITDFGWNSVEWSEELRDEDADIEHALNLLFNIPNRAMPYPNLVINSEGKYKPKVLTIGDSYFWRFVRWGGLENIYNNSQFWYYNKESYPGQVDLKTVDFGTTIEQQDVVCIYFTTPALGNFTWGFIEQLDQWLIDSKGQVSVRIEAIIQQKILEAKENPEWMAHIQKQATAKGISIDDALRAEIEFILEDPVFLEKEKAIYDKMQEARRNTEWMEHIQKQADEKGISLEKALRQEVEYVLQQEAEKN